MEILTQFSLFNLLLAIHILVAIYGFLLLAFMPTMTNYYRFITDFEAENGETQTITPRTLEVALKLTLLIPIINLVALYYLLGFLATTDKTGYTR